MGRYQFAFGSWKQLEERQTLKAFLITLLFSCQCFGQVGLDLTNLKASDLEKLIPIKGREANGGRWIDQTIAEVLAQERLDLLITCFGSRHCFGETRLCVAQLPKENFRLRATITLLRTKSGYWPEDSDLVMNQYLRTTAELMLVEPFTSAVAELLPDVKLDVPMMRTYASRAQLADQLEEALHRRSKPAQTDSVKVEASAPELPIKEELTLPKRSSLISNEAKSKKLEAKTEQTADDPSQDFSLILLLPILACLAAAGWLYQKSKRGS
jgi:hypothetical protein